MIARLPFSALGVLLCLVAGAARAAPLHKNATNPTGIPDFTQSTAKQQAGDDPGICHAAAFGNGMWYFDQARDKKGLVEHSDDDDVKKMWPSDSEALVDEMAEFIYAKDDLGFYGVERYIATKRPDDLKLIERKVRTKDGLKLQYWSSLTWVIKVIRKKANINHAAIQAVHDAANQFGALLFNWHEQNAAADVFMPILDDGDCETVLGGTVSHVLAIAGRETDEDELIVTNGWGNHHGQAATPVDSAYYETYDYVLAGGALRVTDGDLIDSIAGLCDRTPDYAEADQLEVLETPGKQRFGADHTIKFFGALPGAGGFSGDRVRVRTFFYNEGTEHFYEIERELPLRDPSGFALSSVSNVDLPPGWNMDVWDPNLRQGDDIVQNAAPILWDGYDFVGVRFWTDTDPVVGQDGVMFEFDIPESLLTPDYPYTFVNMSAWNNDETQWLSIGGPTVPVPSLRPFPALSILVLVLAGLGAASLWLRRTREGARRD